MLSSMTGFGSGRGDSGGEEVAVEVRAVNHKFCEVKVRLPRELAAMELDLVRQVKERLTRGGVEVSVRRETARGAMAPQVDAALATEYALAFREAGQRLGLPGEVTLGQVLAAEGVVTLEERAADLEAARAAATQALGRALDSLTAMRRREGEALGRDLEARLRTLEGWLARVAASAPLSVEQQRARLQERVQELARGHVVDAARLATEVALFADRVDVTEELTRLRSHLTQMQALVAGREPAGRKMEFLVQEMHREVNTVGAKSQSAEIAAAVVEMKAEIERMREQVQNVE